MFSGHAITNPNHFIESGLVDEVRALYSDVFEGIKRAAAAAKLQRAAALVNYGLALSVSEAEDQINARIDTVDFKLRLIALAYVVLQIAQRHKQPRLFCAELRIHPWRCKACEGEKRSKK